MTMPGTLPTIDVTEAERRLGDAADDSVLIDVREVDEFTTVRAPGAILMPTSSFMEHLGDVPADRPIMVICHLGGRSAAVVGYLARSGRTDVVNVAGGMDAWERAGLPVRRGALASGEGDRPG